MDLQIRGAGPNRVIARRNVVIVPWYFLARRPQSGLSSKACQRPPSFSLPTPNVYSPFNTWLNWKSNELYTFRITHHSQILPPWPPFIVCTQLALSRKLAPMSTPFLLLQVQSSAEPAPMPNNSQTYPASSLRPSPSASSTTKFPPWLSSAPSSATHTTDTRQLKARKSLSSPGRLPPLLPAGALPSLVLPFTPTGSPRSSMPPTL